jgi:4-hydroxy 2-oxovalerate aldolase
LGLHAHNNLGLAFSNSIAAVKHGVKWIDSTILGMGRGPGNLLTEKILKFKSEKNIKYINQLNYIFFNSLLKKYNWGPNKYYKYAAINKIHPTFVQEILSDKRYTTKDYMRILESLKDKETKKYNPNKLFTPNNIFFGKASGSFLPINFFIGKKILILGPGNTVEKIKNKLETSKLEMRPSASMYFFCDNCDSIRKAFNSASRYGRYAFSKKSEIIRR